VVAAASGGNIEAIRDGETGYLVPPDDAAACAERTLRLLKAPQLCRTVAGAARRDARSRFGLRQHADAIMQVYDRMLGRAALEPRSTPGRAEAPCFRSRSGRSLSPARRGEPRSGGIPNGPDQPGTS
jgi:hypothetical protein